MARHQDAYRTLLLRGPHRFGHHSLRLGRQVRLVEIEEDDECLHRRRSWRRWGRRWRRRWRRRWWRRRRRPREIPPQIDHYRLRVVVEKTRIVGEEGGARAERSRIVLVGRHLPIAIVDAQIEV